MENVTLAISLLETEISEDIKRIIIAFLIEYSRADINEYYLDFGDPSPCIMDDWDQNHPDIIAAINQ